MPKSTISPVLVLVADAAFVTPLRFKKFVRYESAVVKVEEGTPLSVKDAPVLISALLLTVILLPPAITSPIELMVPSIIISPIPATNFALDMSLIELKEFQLA